VPRRQRARRRAVVMRAGMQRRRARAPRRCAPRRMMRARLLAPAARRCAAASASSSSSSGRFSSSSRRSHYATQGLATSRCSSCAPWMRGWARSPRRRASASSRRVPRRRAPRRRAPRRRASICCEKRRPGYSRTLFHQPQTRLSGQTGVSQRPEKRQGRQGSHWQQRAGMQRRRASALRWPMHAGMQTRPMFGSPLVRRAFMPCYQLQLGS